MTNVFITPTDGHALLGRYTTTTTTAANATYTISEPNPYTIQRALLRRHFATQDLRNLRENLEALLTRLDA